MDPSINQPRAERSLSSQSNSVLAFLLGTSGRCSKQDHKKAAETETDRKVDRSSSLVVQAGDCVLDLLHQGGLVAVSSTGVVSGVRSLVGSVRGSVCVVGGVVGVVRLGMRFGKAGRGDGRRKVVVLPPDVKEGQKWVRRGLEKKRTRKDEPAEAA
jgi:hypothetical protein